MGRLKIISYNLFQGAQTTRDDLITFLEHENPDILCLQETNDWHLNDFEILADVAKKAGMTEYLYGDSNTDYKLATMSKYPMLSSNIYKQNIWHSMIDCSIDFDGKVIRVVNVHLNPNSEMLRKNEMAHLLTELNDDVKTIIVGDFNSISRRDKYTENLSSKLQAAEIDKFGDTELLYDVTDLMEAEEYHDMAAELNSITNTVPTLYNMDKNHKIPLRLDYAYSNQALKSNISSVSVVKSDLTNQISDHYPLSIAIQLEQNKV